MRTKTVQKPIDCWIFQCDPKHYDIIPALETLDIIPWEVTRYKKKIKAGHKVYIWISGKEAGIIAVGEIVCDPMERHSFNDEQFAKSDIKRPQLVVDIKITQVLSKDTTISSGKFITKETLKNDSIACDMSIIRIPRGTNFKVNDNEEAIIDSLL